MSMTTFVLDGPDLLEGGWMTTEQLAALIHVDASTLRRWRTARPPQGPPFVPLSPRVTVYSTLDVSQWIAKRRTVPAEAS
jgi:hypothetical protein